MKYILSKYLLKDFFYLYKAVTTLIDVSVTPVIIHNISCISSYSAYGYVQQDLQTRTLLAQFNSRYRNTTVGYWRY